MYSDWWITCTVIDETHVQWKMNHMYTVQWLMNHMYSVWWITCTVIDESHVQWLMNNMYNTNIVKSDLPSECTVQYTGNCTCTEQSEKTEDESIKLRLKICTGNKKK